MSKKHFTLDEAIEYCDEYSKSPDIGKKCAAVHLQLVEFLKELKSLRQEDDTADGGWSLVPPCYTANCSFCSHNNGYDCVSPKGPYETDATTCLAFQDIRLMK